MAPSGFLLTGASFAAWGLQLLPMPGSAAQNRWKWRYICVSLIHSLLTGTGIGVLLRRPPTGFMATGPESCCWGQCYFLANGAYMLWIQTWIMCCLSTIVLSPYYMGFLVVSLLLELNSACLHLQKLLLLSHQILFLAFSVTSGPLPPDIPVVMSLWLLWQQCQVPLALVILGGTGLVIVVAASITLCVGIQIVITVVLAPPFLGLKKTRWTRTCDVEPVTRDNSILSLKVYKKWQAPPLPALDRRWGQDKEMVIFTEQFSVGIRTGLPYLRSSSS
ncbi:LOW QUALITY PROTEIN: TLC domain-containing protein 2 [Urocitellus parryii]